MMTEELFRSRARELYCEEGEIEVDAHARVSASKDGAYVEAWVWVPSEGGPSSMPSQRRAHGAGRNSSPSR
jgi:hypothetical protein